MAVVPTIPTFVAGQIVTAAQLNALAAALNFDLYTRPTCKFSATTSQSIPNSVFTVLTFAATAVDTDGGRTGAGSGTDRYVCRTAGWYSVSATMSYLVNTAGARGGAILVNGTPQNGYACYSNAVNDYTAVGLSGLVHMNVGDYLQVQALQSSGGALSTVPGTFQGCSVSLQLTILG